MSKVGRWSTTAGNNNSTPPDGWPEGQAPSTVNDCARENMAAIRTAFNDLQYFDQDFTPTFINALSFSVLGNQTSAIHAGRRLKMFDAGNVLYGTVATASFTTVTTINISADAGSLTSSLSSFGIAILGADTNSSIPRRVPGFEVIGNMSVSGGLTVAGTLSISGSVVLHNALSVGATALFAGAVDIGSTLTVSGQVTMKSGLSVSGTVVAVNVAKAWCRISASAGSAVVNGFNVASCSRSAVGIYRINFSTAFTDANYAFIVNGYQGNGNLCYAQPIAGLTGSFKFRIQNAGFTVADADIICATFWR